MANSKVSYGEHGDIAALAAAILPSSSWDLGCRAYMISAMLLSG
jgi:hypothetical protein